MGCSLSSLWEKAHGKLVVHVDVCPPQPRVHLQEEQLAKVKMAAVEFLAMWRIAAWKVTKLDTLVQHPPVRRGGTEIFIHSQRSQILKQQKDDEEQEKADFAYVSCFSGCQSTYLCAGHTYRSFL